jgi:hypothetical protein
MGSGREGYFIEELFGGEGDMDFISKLALVLLMLAGYSMGAVLGSRDKSVTPQLLDLGVVVALWIAALVSRANLGRWAAIGLWLIVAGLVSFGLTSLRRNKMPAKTTRATTSIQEGGFLKGLWEDWKDFAGEMGNYQSRILLAFFYFVVVTPFGLLARLLSDPLRIKYSAGNSFWISHSKVSTELDEARRQF